MYKTDLLLQTEAHQDTSDNSVTIAQTPTQPTFSDFHLDNHPYIKLSSLQLGRVDFPPQERFRYLKLFTTLKWPVLQKLDLTGCGDLSREEIISFIQNAPHLRDLTIETKMLSIYELYRICPHLKSLTLIIDNNYSFEADRGESAYLISSTLEDLSIEGKIIAEEFHILCLAFPSLVNFTVSSITGDYMEIPACSPNVALEALKKSPSVQEVYLTLGKFSKHLLYQNEGVFSHHYHAELLRVSSVASGHLEGVERQAYLEAVSDLIIESNHIYDHESASITVSEFVKWGAEGLLQRITYLNVAVLLCRNPSDWAELMSVLVNLKQLNSLTLPYFNSSDPVHSNPTLAPEDFFKKENWPVQTLPEAQNFVIQLALVRAGLYVYSSTGVSAFWPVKPMLFPAFQYFPIRERKTLQLHPIQEGEIPLNTLLREGVNARLINKAHLSPSNRPQLNIYLQHCPLLTDTDLKQFMRPQRSVGLLNLSYCRQITSTGLNTIFSQRGLTIQQLDVEGCYQVDDTFIKGLDESTIEKLSYLNVSNTSISTKCVTTLKRAYPDINIRHDDRYEDRLRLFNSRELTGDIKLTTLPTGQEEPAHRNILEHVCLTIRALCDKVSRLAPQSSDRKIELNYTYSPSQEIDLKAFLEFVYTEHIRDLNDKTAQNLFLFARDNGYLTLLEYSRAYLLHSIGVHNAISLYSWASVFKVGDIMTKCHEFLHFYCRFEDKNSLFHQMPPADQRQAEYFCKKPPASPNSTPGVMTYCGFNPIVFNMTIVCKGAQEVSANSEFLGKNIPFFQAWVYGKNKHGEKCLLGDFSKFSIEQLIQFYLHENRHRVTIVLNHLTNDQLIEMIKLSDYIGATLCLEEAKKAFAFKITLEITQKTPWLKNNLSDLIEFAYQLNWKEVGKPLTLFMIDGNTENAVSDKTLSARLDDLYNTGEDIPHLPALSENYIARVIYVLKLAETFEIQELKYYLEIVLFNYWKSRNPLALEECLSLAGKLRLGTFVNLYLREISTSNQWRNIDVGENSLGNPQTFVLMENLVNHWKNFIHLRSVIPDRYQVNPDQETLDSSSESIDVDSTDSKSLFKDQVNTKTPQNEADIHLNATRAFIKFFKMMDNLSFSCSEELRLLLPKIMTSLYSVPYEETFTYLLKGMAFSTWIHNFTVSYSEDLIECPKLYLMLLSKLPGVGDLSLNLPDIATQYELKDWSEVVVFFKNKSSELKTFYDFESFEITPASYEDNRWELLIAQLATFEFRETTRLTIDSSVSNFKKILISIPLCFPNLRCLTIHLHNEASQLGVVRLIAPCLPQLEELHLSTDQNITYQYVERSIQSVFPSNCPFIKQVTINGINYPLSPQKIIFGQCGNRPPIATEVEEVLRRYPDTKLIQFLSTPSVEELVKIFHLCKYKVDTIFLCPLVLPKKLSLRGLSFRQLNHLTPSLSGTTELDLSESEISESLLERWIADGKLSQLEKISLKNCLILTTKTIKILSQCPNLHHVDYPEFNETDELPKDLTYTNPVQCMRLLPKQFYPYFIQNIREIYKGPSIFSGWMLMYSSQTPYDCSGLFSQSVALDKPRETYDEENVLASYHHANQNNMAAVKMYCLLYMHLWKDSNPLEQTPEEWNSILADPFNPLDDEFRDVTLTAYDNPSSTTRFHESLLALSSQKWKEFLQNKIGPIKITLPETDEQQCEEALNAYELFFYTDDIPHFQNYLDEDIKAFLTLAQTFNLINFKNIIENKLCYHFKDFKNSFLLEIADIFDLDELQKLLPRKRQKTHV